MITCILMWRLCLTFSVVGTAFLTACGGGSLEGNRGVETQTSQSSCDGSCSAFNVFLTSADVQQVIAKAVAEAQARGALATIAVADRVGNVLAVFRMTGADQQILISSTANAPGASPIVGGLEGINIIPDTMVAIAKAVTAAYLSTEGNAFSTRTASQIVQENFNPGEINQPSGPLFGVQFSQLPCSDLSLRFGDGSVGPKRSPLGLSADPGGLPLYKNGTPVGAVGVIADGVYGLDKNIIDHDADLDELIALAATFGLTAPPDRRADRITVVGKFLRFSDAAFSDLQSDPNAPASFASINGVAGQLVAVNGYYDGGGSTPLAVLNGVSFGLANSGVRPEFTLFPTELDAFVLVDASNNNRFPPQAGTDTPAGNSANALTQAEVNQLLQQALGVANEARAQIRRPVGSPARVTISVVDTNGSILGIVRGRDAPMFGIDVSLQKARTAAFFSGAGTANAPADALRAVPGPVYLDQGLTVLTSLPIDTGDYVTAVQDFLGDSGALETSGANIAFSDRAGGNLSRPQFPDGPFDGPPGPLSKPDGQWSVFSTGLQLDLVYNAIIHHVGFVAGVEDTDVGQNCTGSTNLFTTSNPINALANGIQIFPGSVPIYRGNTLVGGIGVSGDGVDQDDLIAFLGLHRASQNLNNSINNAPMDRRADRLTPQGVNLRYVSCPQSPFIGDDQQNVCDGL